MLTRCRPNMSAPIDSSSKGMLSTPETHSRRVKSTSSGFGASSSEGVSGSSAMPQMGQAPGIASRICGCIGQVHMAPAGALAGVGGASV